MSFNKNNQEIQMNISKTAKAFAIAAVVGLTSQVFGASTNEWWNQNFDSVADMTALTNVSYSVVAGGCSPVSSTGTR